jgi:heat-inducible transcriptional repressor
MSQPVFPGHLSREDPDLSERQRSVLGALIEHHQRSARPAGSDALVREGRFRLSSASVRGTLADLEAAGLVEQLHASSGRIPTEAGYGYFVRTMMSPAKLSPEAIAAVDSALARSRRDVEELLHEASRLLSSLTRQMGLATTSSLEHGRLTRLDLEPLDQRRALMVLNLGPGVARSLVLELDSPLAAGELAEVAEVLRERLLGETLGDIRKRLAGDPELVRDSAVRLVVHAARRSPAWPSASPLFSSGARHIVEQPDFAVVGDAGSILDAVEHGFPLDVLMVSAAEGQPAVRVGLDEALPLRGCSLVSYALPGAICGAVGVLGPRRMDYAGAFAVVEVVGSRVADILGS